MAFAACENRLLGAVEASRQNFEPSVLNYQGRQFMPRNAMNTSWSLDQGCTWSSGHKSRLKAMAASAAGSSRAGSEQKRGEFSQFILNEAYLTIAAPREILVDIGKKDITNGYLLFLSPMDILRKPIAPPAYGAINSAGPSWRSSYREGSIGVSATKFLDWGTMELAAFPQLGATNDRPLPQWSSLQRSNGSSAVYASYSASLWESFNPKMVALFAPGRQVGGVGFSDVVTEGVVLTAELAQSSSNPTHRLSKDAVGSFLSGGFPKQSELFEQNPGRSQQLAAGLRINTSQKTTLIGEFYFQSNGYTKSDWNRYFQLSDYALAAYGFSGFSPYLDYQRLLLSAADANHRQNTLLGKRYLTLGMERSTEGFERFGWHSSILWNMDDNSSLVNLHLTYMMSQNTEFYLGSRGMFGDKRSEFGRFGQSPLVYFGVKFSL